MGLLVIGANHRTAPRELREAFALLEADLAAMLERLAGAGLGEVVLIATCDRIELVTPAADDDRARAVFAALLAERTGLAADAIAAALYRHDGAAALRHLFAVAAALDSLVIGEPQVLGQVKAAHRLAAELGLAGSELEAAFAGAAAAARDIHGDLARCSALLLGPGEMGELMAEQFQRAGLRHLVVCGPPARAEQVARRLACNIAPLEQLDEALAAADIVIAALGSGRAVLTVPRIAAALRRRPARPIFVIDAAIPADAEPAVNDLDGAFLYDLADLERAALAGKATREAASVEAWRIIEAELAAFAERRAQRRAVPAVVALRAHVEALRQQALAEAGGDAERATRLLANRLLHDPSEVLREAMGAMPREAETMADLLRRLFRLSGDEERTE
jgi:glutamyl-tRNA reductase